MIQHFGDLLEALAFVSAHGGPTEVVVGAVPGYTRSRHAALGVESHFVKLADGCYFGVEAYSHGPLSEVTPDEDFGVMVIGVTP